MLMSSCTLQANKPEYYRIDGETSLRQELSGKAVIEFPVLTVLLPGEENRYSLAADVAATTAQAEQMPAEQPDANDAAM